LILWPNSRNEKIIENSVINGEIANQINTAVTDMADAATNIMNNGELRARLAEYRADPNAQTYNRVRLALNQALGGMSAIRGAVLDSRNGTRFDSVVNLAENDLAILDTARYVQIRDTYFANGFSEIYSADRVWPIPTIAYSLNTSIGTDNYTITVFFDVSSLIRSVGALSLRTFNGYLITDSTGMIIFYTGNVDTAQLISTDPAALVSSLLNPNGYFRDSDGYYFMSMIASSGWIAAGYVGLRNFNITIMQQFYYMLILFLLMAILTIMLILPVTYHAMRPVKELSAVIDAVSLGDLSRRSTVATDDEIGRLSDVFNHMVESLQKNIDDRLAYEANEQHMKYNLLIAQFDSHFINNTLSTISALARRGRTDDIIIMNAALAHIMQNYLRVKTYDVTDTIGQEVDVVRQYWVIVNMRYDNHVNLVIDLPDELAQDMIPKNLIQPLVENSLFHGLVDEISGEMHGEIKVAVRKSDSAVIITVADNGKGIDADVLAILNEPVAAESWSQENRGRHIGIHNIRQRLAHIYKQHDCIQISSSRDESAHGTVVTLVLPCET
jgi:sensor histidine kinase YesM